MSNVIKDWSITTLCLSIVAIIWFASSPSRLGYWEAQRDVAYESIWSEHITDCDCTDTLE